MSPRRILLSRGSVCRCRALRAKRARCSAHDAGLGPDRVGRTALAVIAMVEANLTRTCGHDKVPTMSSSPKVAAMANTIRRAAGAIISGTLCTVLALAQAGPESSIGPLRTAPAEKLTVNPGFRDWGPTTIAGTTILAGNSTNKGGLFAVDTLTGKLKWTSRPAALRYGPSVSTRARCFRERCHGADGEHTGGNVACDG